MCLVLTLILGCSLSETRRQFEVAFKMIDVDCSDFIDRNEFRRVGVCVCVCVCVCARACVRAYVRAYMSVCAGDSSH